MNPPERRYAGLRGLRSVGCQGPEASPAERVEPRDPEPLPLVFRGLHSNVGAGRSATPRGERCEPRG